MTATLEERMERLEAEVADLRQRVGATTANGSSSWWKPFVGAFENDPLFEKAVESGRQYRDSFVPRKNAAG